MLCPVCSAGVGTGDVLRRDSEAEPRPSEAPNLAPRTIAVGGGIPL